MAIIQDTIEFPAGVATWVRDAADLANCLITLNNELSYDVSYCGDYALYYLNSYGGWDAFLFEKPVKRIDELESLTYERYADNRTLNYGTNKYQVNVQPTYECNTGYLSDEQAANFAKNLLSTTKAYLHNLKDNTIVPVMVDSTSAEYKTFKNNGRKLITYTFTIRESQNKIRR